MFSVWEEIILTIIHFITITVIIQYIINLVTTMKYIHFCMDVMISECYWTEVMILMAHISCQMTF